MDKYQNFLYLYNKIAYIYQGIKLNDVSAVKIWGAANGKRSFTWHHFFKMFVAFSLKDLKLPVNNGFLATFMDNKRADHLNLFNRVVDNFSSLPTINYLFDFKKKVCFHPLLIIKTFVRLIKDFRHIGIPFTSKLHWIVEYIYLENTILELNKIDISRVRKYLCMSHVLDIENLLTQYLRQKGVITYSLQDGIYYIFKKNAVVGSVAYNIFAADHLLCWGQYTKDEYTSWGIDSSRLSVAGYPKGNLQTKQKNSNKYYKCLVMLAGPNFGDVNTKLLNILSSLKTQFEFVLKSHPNNFDVIDSYAKKHSFGLVPKGVALTSCFEGGEYDFCIAVNTTSYYESWIAGLPSIRYFDDRFDVFYGFDDSFSTEDEFLKLVDEYRNHPKTDEEVKKMLEYAIGFGINRYDAIVNG